MSRFQRLLFIGSTNLVYACAKIAADFYNEDGPSVSVFDTAPSPLGGKCGPSIQRLTGPKAELMALLAQTELPTAVLSINNQWLIPPQVIANPALVLINLHHGLLPKHPGRNAGSWAIYEGDREAGITWHYIVEDVDAGDIICQRSTVLGEDATSLSLQRQCAQMAKESLADMLPLENLRPQNASKQPLSPDRRIHLSADVPNGGYLDPDWTTDKMSRFLRAMDFGAMHTLGVPKLKLSGECFEITKYRICPSAAPVCGPPLLTRDGSSLVIQDSVRRIELTVRPEKENR